MFRSKRQQEIVQSTEAKLAKMFEEFNAENHPEDDGRLVCETRCTMARIRSFSDFMYLMKVRRAITVRRCFSWSCWRRSGAVSGC